jgi:two-component system, chemotaxis family, sensor kinase CheA
MSDAEIGFSGDDSDDEIREIFKEEADELIVEIGEALQILDGKPQDEKQIERLVRAMHTIRGSGRACGLTHIADFAHVLESFFDLVSAGKVLITAEAITLTRSARDQFQAILDACYNGGSADPVRTRTIIASFKNLVPGTDLPLR